jgi:hypothetical protein
MKYNEMLEVFRDAKALLSEYGEIIWREYEEAERAGQKERAFKLHDSFHEIHRVKAKLNELF